VSDVELRYLNRDERPAFVLDDVHSADFFNIDAQPGAGAPQFMLKDVTDFSAERANGVADTEFKHV